jgi:predicted adenine nucleotide alpha hydrolase (AANH) superfamily ATPase
MKKLLLHTCCGPCFLGTWEDLEASDFEVTNYFYNPNIQPKEEYKKRLENLKITAEGKSAEIIEEFYDENEHLLAIQGMENEFPRRCMECYKIRLRKTAETAKTQGFDAFSTTLLVSPYQQHEALKDVGQQVGADVGVDFYYRDWRPYFRKGQESAKEMEIYRQKYCGCTFSLEEATKK